MNNEIAEPSDSENNVLSQTHNISQTNQLIVGIQEGEMEPAGAFSTNNETNVADDADAVTTTEDNDIPMIELEEEQLDNLQQEDVVDGQPSSAIPPQNGQRSLQEIKSNLLQVNEQMISFIAKVEQEFDNEKLRIKEEVENALNSTKRYGIEAVAHVEDRRNSFRLAVFEGMKDFEELQSNSLKNIELVEFIHGQIAVAFHQAGSFS